MITDENWADFIIHFFGAPVEREWIKHVSTNWNPLLNQAACGCTFIWFRGPEFCMGYLELVASRIHDD